MKKNQVRETRAEYRAMGEKKNYELQVVIEQDEDGVYIASCPALQGCYTQGDTFEEAIENIKDAIKMCLEELREEGKKIKTKYPQVIGLKNIEVKV